MGSHTITSAIRRLYLIVQKTGAPGAMSVALSILEDYYLKSFDRRYGVRTSGYIDLAETSVDSAKRAGGTRYRGVNAWAFRRLLKTMALPKHLRFVDLGCGLGRACILAAEYGFQKVTGVEYAPELYRMAVQNIETYCSRNPAQADIEIIEGDAVQYCASSKDDVVFMYRPFSGALLRIVLQRLAESSRRRMQPIIIIYSERLLDSRSELKVFGDFQFSKLHEAASLGQEFNVFQCVP